MIYTISSHVLATVKVNKQKVPTDADRSSLPALAWKREKKRVKLVGIPHDDILTTFYVHIIRREKSACLVTQAVHNYN